jgi:hypothetical protein
LDVNGEMYAKQLITRIIKNDTEEFIIKNRVGEIILNKSSDNNHVYSGNNNGSSIIPTPTPRSIMTLRTTPLSTGVPDEINLCSNTVKLSNDLDIAGKITTSNGTVKIANDLEVTGKITTTGTGSVLKGSINGVIIRMTKDKLIFKSAIDGNKIKEFPL